MKDSFTFRIPKAGGGSSASTSATPGSRARCSSTASPGWHPGQHRLRLRRRSLQRDRPERGKGRIGGGGKTDPGEQR
ncbi:hypothetical protein ACPA9J_29680 [Pseudomonas aeruginosa]